VITRKDTAITRHSSIDHQISSLIEDIYY